MIVNRIRMGELEIIMSVIWSLFRAGVVFIAGFLMATLIGIFLRRFLHKKEMNEYFKSLGYGRVIEDIIVAGVKYLIYLSSALIALTQLGMGVFFIQLFTGIAILVAITVLIFSLRDFIRNAASGLYILRSKIFKRGEKIKINGIEGKILRIDLLTTILSEKDKRIVIPNTLITKQVIIKK